MKMRRIWIPAALVAAFSAAMGVSIAGQSLPQQNQEILNELKAIRQLLEKLTGPLGQQPPSQPAAGGPVDDRVNLAVMTGPVLGSLDAPLTMVEFTDLQCPFCRKFHVTTFEQIKKEYIDTGKLKYISRDFPLESIHPIATAAAYASRCAGDQDRFWEMRHTILLNSAGLNADVFRTFAQDLKLNIAAFQSCEASAAAKFQADLQKDKIDASSIGVTGTPTFVIGRTTATGFEGVRMVGAQPFAAFDAKIKELLAKQPATP